MWRTGTRSFVSLLRIDRCLDRARKFLAVFSAIIGSCSSSNSPKLPEIEFAVSGIMTKFTTNSINSTITVQNFMEQGVFSILYETQIVAKAGRNRWKRTMEWCVRAHVLLRERNNSSRLKATLGGADNEYLFRSEGSAHENDRLPAVSP